MQIEKEGRYRLVNGCSYKIVSFTNDALGNPLVVGMYLPVQSFIWKFIVHTSSGVCLDLGKDFNIGMELPRQALMFKKPEHKYSVTKEVSKEFDVTVVKIDDYKIYAGDKATANKIWGRLVAFFVAREVEGGVSEK